MTRIVLLIYILTFCTGFLYANDTVIVHKDARLDILSTKQAAVNKLTSKMTSNGQYKGFRLQVLNSRSRDDAFKIKAQLLQLFPDQKTYVLFQSPYFKVRIGNFIEKSEALSFKNQLAKKYPQNAYVVEDIIEYTPEDDEDPVAN
ncbi:SPOR domain-containing protein [Panacibacter ginsenosidivorans]|uniref:SPOR domain-containing protein n=1 Tax=Panacibacter ginsenosidivorans TaxID=1813871 RepID=A0A5B8VCF2_9BACT|nr:SPOR domain-containing protein [Panacibacter ginsenosidivorans]QEC68683.1 SPOR domain-containing protein [Panacibacter ginsenosidivorans]